MERLNPLDAQFIDAEDQDRHASFAIASISVFDGPAPSYEEFERLIRDRLPQVPAYRWKLRTVPLRLGPPVWVDASDFDLRYHLRHVAVPAPGDDAQLSSLTAQVMSQRLDRDHPLWEYWLVDGLSRGHWAVISKVHHAMMDGVSGAGLHQVIFDVSADVPPAAPAASPAVASPAAASPAPAEPSSLVLAGGALADVARLPGRAAGALRSAAAQPGQVLRQGRELAAAAATMGSAARPATPSSLGGHIGSQRRYTWARASLKKIKRIKNSLGGTVNDTVLAAIAGGFRALLLSRGEQPQPHMVPSLVPVSTRGPGEADGYHNRLSVVMADLPVQLEDPVERLDAIRAEMATLKQAREAVVGEALVALGRYTPYPLASRAVRLFYRMPQHMVVTVTTNVAGPRQRLYSLGRELVEIIPYVPIATTLRTGISIFSYRNRVTFGITGDYESVPDIDVLARGIEADVAELAGRARG